MPGPCCTSCAIGSRCESDCAGDWPDASRDKRNNPRAIRIDLSPSETLGTATTPEIIDVYQGPVFLELWSYDADTSFFIERVRIGREGQRITTEQRVNTGPVSRRVVEVASNERATVRAWIRAVDNGAAWNDLTGRQSGGTPEPYVQIITYAQRPIEYGASSNAAVSSSSSGDDWIYIAAAHHARYLTVYAHQAQGLLQIEDRAGTVIARSPLQARQVITCSDPWVRVGVLNQNAQNVDCNVYWIASVEPPGVY